MNDITSCRRFFITIFFISLSGFLIYSNILYAPFVFDDFPFIRDNPWIRELANFKDISGTRYIAFLTFAVNYYFGGLNTFGYHLVNIIIHIINAMLVYVLIQLTIGVLMFRDSRVQEPFSRPMESSTIRILPFAVSLIFLVHPIQTQSVTYIVQRTASLATLFYLLALVLYAKGRSSGQWSRVKEQEKGFYISLPLYFLSLFFTLLAMKTKELSFTLPFIIILYEWTFFREEPPLPLGERIRVRGIFYGKTRTRLLYLAPYFLMLAIIPYEIFFIDANPVQMNMQNIMRRELGGITGSKYNYLITQFKVIFIYIRLLILPINQHFSYDYPNLISKSIFELKTFLSFISLLFMLFFSVFFYLRSVFKNNFYGILISFGILWFFITLSVVSAIPISGIIFEHWLYLPSVGFILSVAAACSYLFNKIESKIIRLFLFLFIVIAIAPLSIATYKRNSMYKDSLTIYLDEAKYYPNRADTHYQLALIYLNRNMLDEAEREFRKTLEVELDSPVQYLLAYAYNNIGIVYLKKGNIDMAIKAFQEAIKIEPHFLTTYDNMGFAYFDKGDYDKAMEMHKKALEIDPDFANAHYGLAEVYEKKGVKDEAIGHYKKYIRYANPKEQWVEKARKKIQELETK